MSTAIKTRNVFSTKTQKVYDEALALLPRAAILQRKEDEEGQMAIAAEIRKHYRRCVKQGFNFLSLEFAKILQNWFIKINNARGVKQFSESVAHLSKMYHLETTLSSRYEQLRYLSNNSRTTIDVGHIEGLDVDNVMVRYYATLLSIMKAEHDGSFEKIVSLCWGIIRYLESNKIDRSAHFYYILTPTLITLKRYKEAEKSITEAIPKIKKGAYNWSAYLFYKFQLELHRKDYQSAYEVFKKAERKKQINPAMEEQWLIAKGYLEFLYRKGKVSARADFKMGKFLNETEIFSRDKKGNNINIIILQLLLRGTDFAIDSADAVLQYIKRHKIKGREAAILKRLVGVKSELEGRVNIDLEVVPYEDLWGIV